MPVNRYQINLDDLKISGATINIPINLDFQPVDQAEKVESDFVSFELENAINPIVDYEKARFIPMDELGNQIEQVIYDINLLDVGNTFPASTSYGTEEYEYDDLKFRKNSFKRSFLRLSFYDSDIPTNQNLMSFMTLFSRLRPTDLIPVNPTFGLNNIDANLPKPLNDIPIMFAVEDPILFPDGIAEGYHIYHFKDEVSDSLPKELFMRASWNNAKSGKSVPLITTNVPQTIDNLVSKLHTKYILKRDNTGWFYEIDATYSSPTNVVLTGLIQTVSLYEIQVL